MYPRTLVRDHAFPQLTHKASITLVLSDHLATGQETLYPVPVGRVYHVQARVQRGTYLYNLKP